MLLQILKWGFTILIPYIIYQYISSRSRVRKLPPGPKPLPLIGNLQHFPPPGIPEYQHWLSHRTLYGPISSVSVLGTTLVLIHDKKAAHDLLELNSGKTSGRPEMVFANQLCGYQMIIMSPGMSDKFRRARKLLHRELGTKASSAQFGKMQEVEVGRQLVRSLEEPGKWLDHYKTTAGAIILKMAYGYTIESKKNDVLVDLSDRMMTEFSHATVPFAWAVDILPVLRYLPVGFPGFKFKEIAREWRKNILGAAYTPYRFVQRQMSTHDNEESYVSKLLQQFQSEDEAKSLTKEDEDAIIWSAASLYGGGADTTIITLQTFTLAMLLFPDVQLKAQQEIDRVIGTDRLPNFEDRDCLPYINAVVKEAVRWWPIAPMGFPHAADSDIEYAGLHIPKGALLLPAVWWFLHDPNVYADPDTFDPERFLEPRNQPDPTIEAFGYGRRICPGRFFADASLYLNIAQSLAVFNLAKAVDGGGRTVEVDVKMKPGILAYPSDFEVKVTPRSARHAELVRQIGMKYPLQEGDASLLRSETE